MSEWPPPRPRPTDTEWDQTKARFPVGTTMTAPVIARQPFGLFLDLGDDVLGLMELPSLAEHYRPLVAHGRGPDLGTPIAGRVIGHRDLERQVALAAADAST